MPKPLIIDLPYPSLNGVEKDHRTARIICPAYASSHGELNAILQYVYHFLNFNAQKQDKASGVLMSIALAEMKHLEILGELLYRLGVDPIFTRFPPYRTEFYSTGAISYSKLPIKMLLDDITGEMLAVQDYQKMVNAITCEQVSAVISRIILDEELHIKALKDLMKDFIGDKDIY